MSTPELTLESSTDLSGSPWSGPANRRAALTALVASAGLGVAWNGISREATFDGAQPWFFLAVMALLLGFAAAALWLSSAARRIHRVRTECHEILRREFGEVATAVDTPERSDSRYVRAAGMVRIHLETCEFMTGKTYDEVPIGSDTERCGVCRP